MMTIMLLALPLLAFSQVRYTVKGKVSDSDGQPLIGATVNLGGTLQGASTDIDGNYMLSGAVKEGPYSLVFSYLGYAAQVQSITIGEATKEQTVDISLKEDALGLDEVIVTGNSTTTTRRQLGNSISVVRADALERTGTTNTLAALSGKVMGAQISQNSGDPAGGMSVRLRGAGSINSSSDPLYIIDGVIVDNSSQNVINRSGDAMATSFSAGQNRLIDINPNDIERVEVLNGAAAAAIYGSRAANGVVQIFTKRGKAGKNVIEFSSTLMHSSLRQKIFMSQVGERFGVKGNDRLETTQDRLTTILNLYPNVAVPGKTAVQVMDANGVKYAGVGLGATPARFLITDKYAVKRYDYQDDIFSDAIGTDNNLSMSGGNDKTQYFASFGFLDNDGIITNTNYKKYTGRLNLDQMLSSWAKFSAGLGYTYGVSQDMPNGNNFFNPISALFISDNVWDINERDANGNLKQTEKVRINPLSIIETYKMSQRTNRTIANAKLELFPIKGLKIDASVGSDAYTLRGDEYHARLPYELSATVVPDFYPDGYVAQAVSNVSLLNHNFIVNYSKEFGKVSSSTTAGYDIQYSNTSFISQEGRGLSFGTTLNAASNLFKRTEPSKSEQLQNGYFVQQTFGYNNQIYLTVAGRIDGSSVFAPENRNQFYPKAGLSWVLSDYWKGKGIEKILSSAKVRASFGEAGNLTGIGAYDRFDNYGVSAFNGLTSIAPSRVLANANVKPERKRETEFGLDLSFLNNRIGLNVNVYDQKVTDLLITGVMAASGGGTRIIKNAPDSTYLTNKGVEIMLTANVIKTKNFNWNVGVNWSTNKNKIFAVEGGLINLRGADGTQSVVNGQPYGVFYGRYYARDASGNLLLTSTGLRQPTRGTQPISYQAGKEVLENGQPSTKGTVELRKVIGDPNPDWVGSFTSGLSFKKLTFAFQFDAFWGADIYNWNRITSNNVGWGEIAEQEIKGLVPRGTVASIAGGIGGQRIQEEHVEDASYIKLRELSLTYDFGAKAKGLNIGIIGRNLYSFDSYQGFDPETNSAGQSDRVRGDDFGAVPIPRSIMVRAGIKF